MKFNLKPYIRVMKTYHRSQRYTAGVAVGAANGSAGISIRLFHLEMELGVGYALD